MKTALIPARTSALFVFMSAPFASTVAACQLTHNIYQMNRVANFNSDNRDGSAQLVAVIPTRRRALRALRLTIRSKVHLRRDRRRSALCSPPHTACRYRAESCRSWWSASGEPHCKGNSGTASSSTSEGTPRELRGAYLEESDPVPPQSRL